MRILARSVRSLLGAPETESPAPDPFAGLAARTLGLRTESGASRGGAGGADTAWLELTPRTEEADRAELTADRLKLLFDYAPYAVYLVDLKGSFIDGNREAERMIGYRKGELIGKNFLRARLLTKDQLPRAAGLLAQNILGRPTGPDEFVLTGKDGQQVTVEIRTFPLRVEGQTLILGIANDISGRKKSEEEVTAWEKRFELIIEASGQIVYDYDLDTGRIDWSGNLSKVLGYVLEDMGGIDEWAERIHPDDRAEALRLLDEAEKARETYEVDYRFRNSLGAYRWLHDRGFFLIDEKRGSRRMVGMMQDITDRKQAELLQNAVYRIAQAADKSPSLDDLYKSVHKIVGTVMPAGNFYIALYDGDKDLISFPYYVDEEDAPPEPARPGKGLTEYVIRTSRPLLCDEATDRGLRSRGEVEIIGAPSAIWLGVPLIVDGVTIGAMVVQHYEDPKAYGQAELRMLEFVSSQVARSIQRKRAEDSLRRNQQRLALHIQQTPLAVIEWDTDFRVLQWNDSAERIFGYPAAEAIGKHASFIIAEAAKAHVDAVWADLMASRGGKRSTNKNVTKDGREIYCEWYNTTLAGADGRAIGVASLAQDVSDRFLAEAGLRDGLAKLRSTLKASIDSLASAIEMRDPYTAGHQDRVARLARAIAVEMGLDEERIEAIEIAGVIHDIGKLYVPAEILSKPTKLTELEYALIKMHAQAGYTILSKIDFPWPIAQIVHQHHELVNGSGYPRGLAGKEILLEARILCVADVVEAMSSHRPDRPALGIQSALEEIAQKQGLLYDREVVAACLRVFNERRFKFD
ncbi:MAG: PAS domain S-box protein [Candidatus Aminicenantes bacterium]|nr:PAS domain S-box protein [Candidatus Aminicenantes bacterium]